METELISIDGPGPLNPIGEPKAIDWTRPVRTKDMRPVRILAIDHSLKMPVIGVYKGTDEVCSWFYDGSYMPDRSRESFLDLENVPEVDTGVET